MKLIYDSGYTVYAVIRRSDGYVYNHTTAVFEVWSDAKLANEEYDYVLTDEGGDMYTWVFPVIAANDYLVVYYLMGGGGTPTVNDFVITDKDVTYNGSVIVDPEDAPSGAYISVETGNNLALNRLNTGAWDDSSDVDKTTGIQQATEILDTLNYIGERTDDDQDLEFPRDEDTEIPVAIQRATFEIALALLDGADPDFDFANLNLVSQGIANIRSTYNRSSSLPHIIAGVPSPTAWRLLLPYLRDWQNVKLSRVN